MSEERTLEATKVLESVEQLIDSVCERKIGWTEERQLLDKLSEMRDKSMNEMFNFEKTLYEQIASANELIGIAQGIEYALCVLGLSRPSYEEEIKTAKEDIDERADKEAKVEREYLHVTLNKCSKLKTQYYTAYQTLEAIEMNEYDSPSRASQYVLETLEAPED